MTEKEEIARLQKKLDDFVYVVSHDLKAPLRAISNLTEWIEEDLGEASEDVKENLNLVKGRINKMNNIIDGLSLISRVNRRDLDLIETDVKQIVSDITEYLKNKYPKVYFNVAINTPSLVTYNKKLKTVLEGVIDNAIIHNLSLDKIDVNIKAEEVGDFINIKIDDNGKGIPAEAIGKVFDLFYTLEPKDKSETIGVGLTVIKSILEFVKGDIEIKSNDKGVEVLIKWPKKTTAI